MADHIQGQVLHAPVTMQGIGVGLDEIARKRSKAWSRARRHTWMVRVLRVALPVLAVTSLGLYFKSATFSIDVPGGEASIEDIKLDSQNLKMINPKFAGYGQGDDRYEVRAESALQDIKAPHKVTLNSITAELKRAKDDWVRMSASKGFFDTNGTKLDLFGGIRVTTKSGMQADLKSAVIDVKSQEVTSREPVNVKLPNGTVRADRLQIFPKENRLRFEGRVQVRLQKHVPAKALQSSEQSSEQSSGQSAGTLIKGVVQ